MTDFIAFAVELAFKGAAQADADTAGHPLFHGHFTGDAGFGRRLGEDSLAGLLADAQSLADAVKALDAA